MKWYALWQGIMAGYTALIAASQLANIVGPKAAAVMILVGASLNAGSSAYYAASSKIVVSPGAAGSQRLP